MTKRIFSSILLASLLATLLCFSLITVLLHMRHDRDLWDELEDQGHLAAAGVEKSGVSYLDNLRTVNRITLIANDGSVVFDSDIPLESLDNHANREEFISAQQTGEGRSERSSDNLSSVNNYYALRLSNGSVLRVSAVQPTLLSVLLDMLIPFSLIILAAVILSIFLAITLSKRIVRPINAINVEDLPADTDYPEISGLIHKIKRQNILISEQIKDLKSRSEQFRTITENMQEGLLILDAKGDLLVCNKAALRLMANEDSLPPVGGSIFETTASPVLHHAVRLALEGHHNEQRLTFGETVYSLFANPVIIDGNTAGGAVILIMDITELQNREEMRREFTSNVSHELKTPLTSIYGISEMMQNGMVRAEDISKFASNIHEETGRLISLVNDIIRLSQLDENKAENEKESVDLYELAKQILSRLQAPMQARGVQPILLGKSTRIIGVRTILSEILYNLIDNAIKYNVDGGTVTVSIDTEDGHPILRVADTGIGIPQKDLGRVFERFYRVDKSHSREIGGTGLGLSIVKHGCVYHGAKIHIASTVGKGTTVSIRFADSI